MIRQGLVGGFRCLPFHRSDAFQPPALDGSAQIVLGGTIQTGIVRSLIASCQRRGLSSLVCHRTTISIC